MDPAVHTNPSQNTILLVDDDELIIKYLGRVIGDLGLGKILACTDPRQTAALMASQPVDVVLLDLHMPWLGGREVLERLSTDHPEVPVIIMTSEDKVETAVQCMREGAFDFLTKPLERNRLNSALRHALAFRDLRQEVQALASRATHVAEPEHPEYFEGILTRSPILRTVFSYIEAIAPSPRAVLITGESGTGKEMVARAIHKASQRPGAFVAVNVSGLDDTVFSDTLFGHQRGAYTGADQVRRGLIEEAKDGTLFLDEIGDLGQSAQVKLLRLLQEGEYYPLGADRPSRSRARIVAATNADLTMLEGEGRFRKDLYWRLVSHHVALPPLRERQEDIPLLFRHFLSEAAAQLHKPLPPVGEAWIEDLRSRPWPGNVRELQALAWDTLSRGSPEPRHEDRTAPPAPATPEGPTGEAPASLVAGPGDLWLGDRLPTLEEAQDFLIREALRRSGGKQVAAARHLGISQPSLSRWLRQQKSPPDSGARFDDGI